MSRHDPYFRTSVSSAAGNIKNQGSAVSYLLQFPALTCLTSIPEPHVAVAALDAEVPRWPVAHMYSA